MLFSRAKSPYCSSVPVLNSYTNRSKRANLLGRTATCRVSPTQASRSTFSPLRTSPARPRVVPARRARRKLEEASALHASPPPNRLNLETAVGCARVCRDRRVRQGRARTQGVLRTACAWRAGGRLCPPRPARQATQRATARKCEPGLAQSLRTVQAWRPAKRLAWAAGLQGEQRGMALRVRCNRAHSAVTERVKTLEAVKLKEHAAFRTGASGQLRFLG